MEPSIELESQYPTTFVPLLSLMIYPIVHFNTLEYYISEMSPFLSSNYLLK